MQVAGCPIHRAFVSCDEWEVPSPLPDGLKRYQQGRDLHFTTWSCYHRHPYLASPHAKQTVEQLLEQTRARHGAQLLYRKSAPTDRINSPPIKTLGPGSTPSLYQVQT